MPVSPLAPQDPRVAVFKALLRAVRANGPVFNRVSIRDDGGLLRYVACQSQATGQHFRFFRTGTPRRWCFLVKDGYQDAPVAMQGVRYTASRGLSGGQEAAVRAALCRYTSYTDNGVHWVLVYVNSLLTAQHAPGASGASGCMFLHDSHIGEGRPMILPKPLQRARLMRQLAQIVCGGDVAGWAERPGGGGPGVEFSWVSPRLHAGFRFFAERGGAYWQMSIEPWADSCPASRLTADSRRGLERALVGLTSVSTDARAGVIGAIERVLSDVCTAHSASGYIWLEEGDVPDSAGLFWALAQVICGDDGDVSAWREHRVWSAGAPYVRVEWKSHAHGVLYEFEKRPGHPWAFAVARLDEADFDERTAVDRPVMVSGPRFSPAV
jgi:hypothetical protein